MSKKAAQNFFLVLALISFGIFASTTAHAYHRVDAYNTTKTWFNSTTDIDLDGWVRDGFVEYFTRWYPSFASAALNHCWFVEGEFQSADATVRCDSPGEYLFVIEYSNENDTSAPIETEIMYATARLQTPSPNNPGAVCENSGIPTFDWPNVSGATAYEFLYCKGANCSPSTPSAPFSASQYTPTTAIIDDQDKNEVYRFRFRATCEDCPTDSEGAENIFSSYSSTKEISYVACSDPDPPPPSPSGPPPPPLAAPSGLVANGVCNATDPDIQLNWNSVSGASEYHIERCTGAGCTDFSQINTSAINSFLNAGNVVTGATYRYRIRSHRHSDNVFSSYSGIVSANGPSCSGSPPPAGPPPGPPPPGPPAIPSGVGVVGFCSGTSPGLRVSWNGVSGATEYHIDRCSTASCTITTAVGPDADSPYDDLAVSPGTTYYYRLRAHNHSSSLFSGYSALVPGTSPTAAECGVIPPPPPNVNNAQCLGMSSPASVVAGSTFTASVTMRNNGTKTWQQSTLHKLGANDSSAPPWTSVWQPNRVTLPSTSVSPGTDAQFQFTVTAPSTPGTYNNYGWKMLQENVEWFGQACTQAITVTAPPPAQHQILGRVYLEVNDVDGYQIGADKIIQTLGSTCNSVTDQKYQIDGFSVDVTGPVNATGKQLDLCNGGGGYYSTGTILPNGTYTVSLNEKVGWDVLRVTGDGSILYDTDTITITASAANGPAHHVWFGVKPDPCQTAYPTNAHRMRGCWYNSLDPDLQSPPNLPNESVQFPVFKNEIVYGNNTVNSISSTNPVLDYTWGANDYIGHDQGVNNTGLKDKVVAIWRGKFTLNRGLYTFHVLADDGTRLYVNGTSVLFGSWKDQGPTEYVSVPVLLDGSTTIRLEWYEKDGAARLKFWWDFQPICDSSSFPFDQFHFCLYDSAGGASPPFPNQNTASPYREGTAGLASGGQTAPSPIIAPATGSYLFWDADWGTGDIGGVAGHNDNVIGAWQGNINFNGGSYIFKLSSDDGSKLFIDGVEKALNPAGAWSNHGYTEYVTVPISLSGRHTIRVEYYDAVWTARLRFEIEKTTSMSCTESHPDAALIDGAYYVPYTQNTVDIVTTGVQNAGGVRNKTWSLIGASGGEDDVVWYLAANQGGQVWEAIVNLLANHRNPTNRDYGLFRSESHLYVNAADPFDAATKQMCTWTEFNRVAGVHTGNDACPAGQSFAGVNLLDDTSGNTNHQPVIEYNPTLGRFVIAMRGIDGAIYVKEWNPATGSITGWVSLAGQTSESPILAFESGVLTVYRKANQAAGNVFKKQQTGSGTWSASWTDTGVPNSAFGPIGPRSAAGASGNVYRVIRDSVAGRVEVNGCGAISGSGNGAECVAVVAPSGVAPNETFTATVEVKNIGTTPWTNTAPNYYAIANPDRDDINAWNWGVWEVPVPATPVAPGASHTFFIDAIAPPTTGAYDFRWQMLQALVEPFGEICSTSVPINVGNAPHIEYVAPSNGGTVSNPGGTTQVSVNFDWILLDNDFDPTTQGEYSIEIIPNNGSCSTFTSNCFNAVSGFTEANGNGAAVVTSTTQRSVTLQAGQSYKWRIKAEDSSGIAALYRAESERTFSIQPGAQPPPPAGPPSGPPSPTPPPPGGPADFTILHNPKDETTTPHPHFFSDIRMGTAAFSTETNLRITPNQALVGSDITLQVIDIQPDNAPNAPCLLGVDPDPVTGLCPDGIEDGPDANVTVSKLFYLYNSERKDIADVHIGSNSPVDVKFKVQKRGIVPGRYIVTIEARSGSIVKTNKLLLVVGDRTSGYIER